MRSEKSSLAEKPAEQLTALLNYLISSETDGEEWALNDPVVTSNDENSSLVKLVDYIEALIEHRPMRNNHS
jgi:hypothetical protein